MYVEPPTGTSSVHEFASFKLTFYSERKQAITCLTMHPDKAHVATGQEGPSPVVLVWDSASKPPKTKARLQLGADKNGVSQVMKLVLQVMKLVLQSTFVR